MLSTANLTKIFYYPQPLKFDLYTVICDAQNIKQPGDGVMADNGFPVPQRKPRVKRLSGRSVAQAVAGTEQPYPVYQFSRRVFVERPKHNPFKGL